MKNMSHNGQDVLHEAPTTNSSENGHQPHASSCLTVPPKHGLLLTLRAEDGACIVSFEPDCNYPEIHPNVYAPQGFTNMTLLKGGGSGVTVFSGEFKSASVVMKHGSHKDLSEVFSLATISRELRLRGALKEGDKAATAAATDMRSRIPEFQHLYISPLHLRDRGSELWAKLKFSIRQRRRRRNKMNHGHASTDSIESFFSTTSSSADDDDMSGDEQIETQQHHRQIRVCRATDDDNACGVEFNFNSLDLFLNVQDDELSPQDGQPKHEIIVHHKGFEVLDEIVSQLMDEQKRHLWKFTIGQKTIGQYPGATNGALVHTRGLLEGSMLTNVIDQFMGVISDLQVLTRDNERGGIDKVRVEVNQLLQEERPCASNVSSLSNTFCGKAIVKNFHPVKGRFAKLAHYGEMFREKGHSCLEEKEILPAHYLGVLLQKGNTMDSVFDDATMPPNSLSAFERLSDSWLDVLVNASSCQSAAATNFIWTCGLTDAGLHNTFCSENFLWLFDLGEPELMPIPAFLTKLLMSGMHVFGMEDDDESDGSRWVPRFVETDSQKLALTTSTLNSIPKMHHAFDYALNRFIDEVLEGEEQVRKVLVYYTVLQLVSDAAFCLGRWESKGGGEKKYYTCNRGKHLDKWLWRCLWDLYIATDLWNRHQDMLQ